MVNTKDDQIIPIISDIAFKAIMADNPEFLLMFIKSIIDTEKDEITSIIGYETVPSKINGKVFRSDILVQLTEKIYIIIEMNKSKGRAIIVRNLIQLSRILNRVLPKGINNNALKDFKFYLINLNLFSNTNGKVIEECALCDTDTGNKLSDIFTVYNLSLEKCQKLVYTKNIENLPEMVKWGAIVIEDSLKKISEILGKEMMNMRKKKEFLTKIREFNDNERIIPQWIADETARLAFEDEKETAYDDGREDGLEEGMKKGKREGIEEGVQKSKIQVIKNMIKKQFDYNIISELTGKSVNEIRMIAKQI